MSDEVVGKIVRGVVYDTEIDSVRESIFESMLPLDYLESSQLIDQFKEDNGLTRNEAFDYVTRADVIDSLTRLDLDTLETRNLIIPKECLSESLVKELECVDLAKDLNTYFGERYYNIIESKRSVTPKDFIKREEEKLLQQVDKSIIDPNNVKVFIDGKRVSNEEFQTYLQNNPEMTQMLLGLKWDNFCGDIICF